MKVLMGSSAKVFDSPDQRNHVTGIYFKFVFVQLFKFGCICYSIFFLSHLTVLDENKTSTIYSLFIYYNVNELMAQLKERRYRVCVVGNVTGSSPVLSITFYQYLLPRDVRGRSIMLSICSPHRLKAYRNGQNKKLATCLTNNA